MTQNKIANIRKALDLSLIERSQEVDILLTALLANENALLIGEPGLGKSLLTRRMVECLDFADKSFEVLITKTSEPDELFGPYTLEAVKSGNYKRDTTDMLPESHVAFIDEVFNGSGAILNNLLTILNERKFRNGRSVLDCPLKCAVGASNVWPDSSSGELNALFDRFMLRKEVQPVRRDKDRLWFGSVELNLDPADKLTLKELADAHAEIKAMPIEDDAKECFRDVLSAAAREGIRPSDRRTRKSMDVLRAYAYLDGHKSVATDSFTILADCLWTDPSPDMFKALCKILKKNASPSGLIINTLMMEVDNILDSVDWKNDGAIVSTYKKLHEIGKKLKKIKTPTSEARQAELKKKILTFETHSMAMEF